MDLSKPVRYNPVPIGGPDRPPVTQSPTNPGGPKPPPPPPPPPGPPPPPHSSISSSSSSSSSPGHRNHHHHHHHDNKNNNVSGRRTNHHPLDTALATSSPAVKREPGAREEGADHQPWESEPPLSAATDYTERSSTTAYPESGGGNGARTGTRTGSDGGGGEGGGGGGDGGDGAAGQEEGPQKKRQKRNKPTLSCFECVERKTKCDRGRPNCLACIKRQTECRYAQVANLLEETSRALASGRRATKPPKRRPGPGPGLGPGPGPGPAHGPGGRNNHHHQHHHHHHHHHAASSAIPNIADRGVFSTNNYLSRAAVALSTGLLSNIPYSLATGSNIFGIGTGHPFTNIWTRNWGLDEVIVMMPNKVQCDILLSRYFECVDPVYPMLHRQSFLAESERFWGLSVEERCAFDPAFVALMFVMYGLGTQFRSIPDSDEHTKTDTAEMYASAANQALRAASYLSCASIRSVQTMVLLVYFLINDNHASDGWAFAGILMRQAYAMGLHRDPQVVTPGASALERNERRKLWQAVLLQDTFLTVLLSLPPNATHTDVDVDELFDEPADEPAAPAPAPADEHQHQHHYHPHHHDHAAVVPHVADPPVPVPSPSPSPSTDTAYIRGSWTLANLVQESICSPRCLDMPICATPRQKTKLVADFRAVYRSFPDVFRAWEPDGLAALLAARRDGGRVVRQALFLTSNYFHNLMLVHASESPEVPVNVRGTLEAAHEALAAFFMLFALFEQEARTWWVFSHRAFLEALCIGSVLRETAREPGGDETVGKDQLFVRGRGDIARMVQIMNRMGEGDNGSEVARTRAQVLSEFLG